MYMCNEDTYCTDMQLWLSNIICIKFNFSQTWQDNSWVKESLGMKLNLAATASFLHVPVSAVRLIVVSSLERYISKMHLVVLLQVDGTGMQ